MVDDEEGADAKDRVLICTHENAVGKLVKSKGPVSLPTECIERQFSLAELYGTEGDSKTKLSLLPGQVIFDERIQFLIRQGIPASGIPKCNEAVDGTCPTGTPKAGQEPNSAGDQMLKVLDKVRKKKSFLQQGNMENDATFSGWGGSLATSGSFELSASSGL